MVYQNYHCIQKQQPHTSKNMYKSIAKHSKMVIRLELETKVTLLYLCVLEIVDYTIQLA